VKEASAPLSLGLPDVSGVMQHISGHATTPMRRTAPSSPRDDDCETGEIIDELNKFHLPTHVPVKSGGGIIRTCSFSGTFTSSSTAEPQQRSLWRHYSVNVRMLVVALCAAALLATAISAWMSASRAEERMRMIQADVRVIQADMSSIKTALRDLSSALREQGTQVSGHLTTIRTEHAQLAEGLPATLHAQVGASLLSKMETIEKSLAAKPSTAHFTSPFAQVMQGLDRLEKAAGAHRMELLSQSSELHAVAHEVNSQSSELHAVAHDVSEVAHPREHHEPVSSLEHFTAILQGQAAQHTPEREVAVTFVYEPTAGTSSKLGGALLYWLGEVKADGTQDEVRYTEIPPGMRVTETTRPGECWRARQAASGQILLDKHCATAQPQQEIFIR